MRDTDKQEFAKVWTQCWEMYGKAVTPGILQLAFEALRRYELSDITMAMTRHLNDPDAGQFVPKPADIVRNIDGTKSSRGMLAWSRVEKAIRCVGGGDSVVFDDRIIHAVVSDMGGWISICKTTEDELPFRAREFEKRYRAYVLAPPTEYQRRLAGEYEAHNRQGGHAVSPPVLIGDRNRAELVYQNGGDSSKGLITHISEQAHKTLAELADSRQKQIT